MKTRKNHLRLLILLLLVLLACAGYMTVGVHFENQKLFAYAMRIRTPKLIAMLITAFAIGSASIVFQSIINNTIVTPCLLGMECTTKWNMYGPSWVILLWWRVRAAFWQSMPTQPLR